MSTPVSMLIRHIARYYTDWHVEKELDAVLRECRNDEARNLIHEYARLRRRVSGFRPRTYEAARSNNTHRGIPERQLKSLLFRADRIDRQAPPTCVVCGEPFEAKHSDATQCGRAKCRTKASRLRKKGMVIGRTIADTDACPHGVPFRNCKTAWCRNRLQDLNEHPESPILRAPL